MPSLAIKDVYKRQPQMDEVISETSAYKMLVMLRAVINEGTGGRVRRLYGITCLLYTSFFIVYV